MIPTAPLLEVEDLSVRYGERTAVQNVSLAVRPGELVALTGPNGAGKTTFLRAILGLVSPSDGRVRVGGVPLTSLSYRERARRMAWLPQEEQPQDNVLLLDYVLFGRYAHVPPFYSEDAEDFARAREALRSVDLWDRRDSGIWEVSGGERQRVLLARALTQDAPVLLLDEPTSHLDVAHQLELLDRLARWRVLGGRCVVAAMHDLNLAARYSDRVVVFSRGRLVEDGPPVKVLSTRLLRSVWGVDAELRRDARTGLPYLIPTLPTYLDGTREHPDSDRITVHVIGGGGSASAILRALVDAGYRVTAGALHLLDTDTQTAEELGVPVAAEVPFAPLSREARARNRLLLEAADAIVVAPFCVGPSNLANLEDLHDCAGVRPVVLVGARSAGERDFTGGRAMVLLAEIRAAGALEVEDVDSLQSSLSRALGGPTDLRGGVGREGTDREPRPVADRKLIEKPW